jgi:hypothetical protein
VVHYPDPDMDDETIKHQFKTKVVWALLSRLLRLFPRHRWTGSDECIKDCGLWFAVHNLAQRAVPLWVRATGGASKVVVAPDHGYASDDDKGRVAAAPVQAAAAQDGGADVPDFAAQNKKARGDAQTWTATDPAHILTIMGYICMPICHYMSHYLKLAGPEWDFQNDRDVVNGHPRKFRIVEVARCTGETTLAWASLDLMMGGNDQWVALGAEKHSLSTRGLAFRMLSRQVCGTHMMLRVHHQGLGNRPCHPYPPTGSSGGGPDNMEHLSPISHDRTGVFHWSSTPKQTTGK